MIADAAVASITDDAGPMRQSLQSLVAKLAFRAKTSTASRDNFLASDLKWEVQ